MQAEKLRCCVSGSFKFKPEIDLAIDEFADLGVIVLEPAKGWLYRDPHIIIAGPSFRPLPNEVNIPIQHRT